ncbi:MAG: hypothetical protein HYX74_09730 [Acidobacteria bacterium]|nr:hypothetical protein [Acidobacteriota bacterium]
MGLTVGGILFLALGWGVIIALVVYAFWKVLHVEAKKRKGVHVGDPKIPNP